MVLTFLRPNIRIVVYAVCLFCVVLGLKWATFDRFGSAMPDWDQWDAEAYYAIIPWFEHDHFLKNIFTPHNEHRVVLTKLQNLALTVLNGQWDARLQAVTNAILHSALATALWLLAVRQFRPAAPSAAPHQQLLTVPNRRVARTRRRHTGGRAIDPSRTRNRVEQLQP